MNRFVLFVVLATLSCCASPSVDEQFTPFEQRLKHQYQNYFSYEGSLAKDTSLYLFPLPIPDTNFHCQRHAFLKEYQDSLQHFAGLNKSNSINSKYWKEKLQNLNSLYPSDDCTKKIPLDDLFSLLKGLESNMPSKEHFNIITKKLDHYPAILAVAKQHFPTKNKDNIQKQLHDSASLFHYLNEKLVASDSLKIDTESIKIITKNKLAIKDFVAFCHSQLKE